PNILRGSGPRGGRHVGSPRGFGLSSQAVVGGHSCGETLASRECGVPMDSLSRRWAPLSPVSSHTTVGEKPDEYWWEDHVPTRLYLAPRSCSWRLEGTSGRIGQVNSQGGNLV